MECFLSEKDELLHGCASFLIEAFPHHGGKIKVRILEHFTEFLKQKPTKIRAFVVASLLPVVAQATTCSVANAVSIIDELSVEEKEQLLGYLKLAVAACVGGTDVSAEQSAWSRVCCNKVKVSNSPHANAA